MARSLGPRWNGYVDGIAVRSGTGDLFNKSKAAGVQVDSNDSYQLKFNSNGTIRTMADLASAQTLSNKTIASGVFTGAFSTTGSITSADATTPSFILAAGKTNTGTVVINGKTSGSLILTAADATGQAVTVITAIQTSGAATLTIPDQAGVSSAFVFTSLAQTLTNKTITGNINADTTVLAATATFQTNTVLANLTGLTATLVAGKTYQFEVELYTTQTTNGGLAVAFKYTTATMTSIQVSSEQMSAAALAVANSTTVTDQTKFVDNKTAVYLKTKLVGTMVVGTGGSVNVQACQNTSNSDTTSVLLGSYARFTRVN